MPWILKSGQDIKIEVAGDTVTVYEIEPGLPKSSKIIKPASLPTYKTSIKGDTFKIEIKVPNEIFKRFDLYLQSNAIADTVITINTEPVAEHRVNSGKRWTACLYDLRKWKGKTISVSGQLIGLPSASIKGKTVKLTGWIIADRKVSSSSQDKSNLPFLISQHYRRITKKLFKEESITIAGSSNETPLAKKLAKQRKKSIRKKSK